MTTTTLAPVTNFGVTTSFIPVVTPWPLTKACSSQIYMGNVHTLVAFDPLYYSSIDPSALTCLPPAITSWWFQSRQALFTTSLGPFVCPAAYTTGSASLVNAYTAEVFCCPSGYDFITSCNWATLGQCIMTMTAGQILTYKTDSDPSTWVDVTTTINSEVVTLYGVHVNGFAVSASSITSTSAAASSTTAVSTTSATSTTSVTSATLADSMTSTSAAATNPSKSSGLPLGAEAGIGVGVALAVLISLLVVALLFYRRRASRVSTRNQFSTTPELPKYFPPQEPVELEGPRYELSGSRGAHVEGRWEL